MRKLVLNMENSQKIFFSAANGLQANLIFFELLKYDTNEVEVFQKNYKINVKKIKKFLYENLAL